MSSGVHFSLDNLPERYRVQVASKLSPFRGGAGAGGSAPEGVEARSRTSCGDSKEGAQPSKVARAAKGGMNRTEARFLSSVLGGEGLYEALTFVPVPKCRYTPDFVRWDENGRLVCYEVKGSHPFPSENRARFAFLACRDKFPHVSFRWFRSDRMGRFHEEHEQR